MGFGDVDLSRFQKLLRNHTNSLPAAGDLKEGLDSGDRDMLNFFASPSVRAAGPVSIADSLPHIIHSKFPRNLVTGVSKIRNQFISSFPVRNILFIPIQWSKIIWVVSVLFSAKELLAQLLATGSRFSFFREPNTPDP